MLEQSSLPFPAPEEWRAIPGHEGRYEVSNLGRVRSFVMKGPGTGRPRAQPLVLRQYPNWDGYMLVYAAGRTRAVHPLVLKAFVGPRPEGQQAAHLSGQRSDNRLVNLQWKTPDANTLDKFRHGTVAVGEKAGNAKLTAPQVIEIRAAWASGDTQMAIAARYGLRQPQISSIVRRESWAHVP